MMLVKIVIQAAREELKADNLVIAVNPKHQRFYQKVLLFKQIGPERSYEYVKGNPAIAMCLELNKAATVISLLDRLSGVQQKLDKVV